MQSPYEEDHYVMRSGWLRAAVLGANDGIISTASIAVGVAAASATREPVILASVAGMVAGALSMAAGEYISVSSQADLEKADLAREAMELKEFPEMELKELAAIYVERGLTPALALEVANQLTEHDALGAHARDELGIHNDFLANPLQAALASGAAFTVGAALPVLVVLFAPIQSMVYVQYGATLLFLMLLGVVAAKTGGSSVRLGVLRICFWGTLAMAGTAFVGYLFGVSGL